MEVSDQLHAPAALTAGKEPLVPIGYEAGCTFHNTVEKRNAYQLRKRRPEQTPVSIYVLAVQYIISKRTVKAVCW